MPLRAAASKPSSSSCYSTLGSGQVTAEVLAQRRSAELCNSLDASRYVIASVANVRHPSPSRCDSARVTLQSPARVPRTGACISEKHRRRWQ